MIEETKEERKLIPESDLLALKSRHKEEKAAFDARLAEVQQLADSRYTDLLKVQTARDQAAAELESLKKEAEQLRGIKPLKEQADKRIADLEGKLLDAEKQRITQTYRVPVDKLQGKTLDQLRTLEEALLLVGTRSTGRFDLGAGGTAGGGEKLSATEQMKRGFEQTRR